MTNKELVDFLKSQNFDGGTVDKLKVVYRPYICPFVELLQFVKPNDSVFDIGCGSGQFALLVANFTKAKSISGIEISESLINNAIQLFKNRQIIIDYTFNKYDGKNLPDQIAQHDLIFMIDVLHHIPKSEQIDFLTQLYTKMSVGSRLIIKDIDADSVFVYANKLHDKLLSTDGGNEISLKSAIESFKKIGFEIIETSKKLMFWYPHYTIVAKK